MWTEFLPKKSDVFTHLRRWKLQAKRETDLKLQHLKLDGGMEFGSKAFQEWLAADGVTHEKSAPYEHEQNRLAEWGIQTISQRAMCQLFSVNMTMGFWLYAVETATYLINCSPTTALTGKTPFEAWTGKHPNIKHLYVAMFALCIGWFVQPTWPLYRANMAKAGTVGKPSVARTTRQYCQYHWSHHLSASYHAPVVSCVIRLLFPSPSPSPPLFSPLLNTVAATPPGHLLVVAVACQPATHAGHFLAALSSTQHVFFGPCRHCRHCHHCLPSCPHFPWAHFGIPKGEYDDFKCVVIVQLTSKILRTV